MNQPVFSRFEFNFFRYGKDRKPTLRTVAEKRFPAFHNFSLKRPKSFSLLKLENGRHKKVLVVSFAGFGRSKEFWPLRSPVSGDPNIFGRMVFGFQKIKTVLTGRYGLRLQGREQFSPRTPGVPAFSKAIVLYVIQGLDRLARIFKDVGMLPERAPFSAWRNDDFRSGFPVRPSTSIQ